MVAKTHFLYIFSGWRFRNSKRIIYYRPHQINFSSPITQEEGIMFVLITCISLVRAICLTSGCVDSSSCSTCRTDATHDIWQRFSVNFVCNSLLGSCTPDFSTGNASALVIQTECRQRSSSCCVPDDGAASLTTCDAKTCLVHTGCTATGQCNITSSTLYRANRENCCTTDSGCPASLATSCVFETCQAFNCVNQTRFNGCCDNATATCPSLGGSSCTRSACVPDPINIGYGVCRSGIDANCVCTSNLDCDDGTICSTNTCNTLTNRCTSTFFASSGGSSCCQSATTAPFSCSNGDLCREILGCRAVPEVVNSSLSFLPTFGCVVQAAQSVGCCTSSSQCATFQSNTGSPCVSATCGFGDNSCNTPTSYLSTVSNETLPCCKDSLDCEPTGADSSRCNYLRCNTPEFLAPQPVTYFTCTRQQLPLTCVASNVITTNAETTAPTVAGNCTWTCGQPGSNVIRLRSKLKNPSSGPNFASPLYLYNVTVRINNFAPVLPGIISAVTLVPVAPYFPATRFIGAGLFVITQPSNETASYYKQEFSLSSQMPIYPDEELTVEITITLRVNATLLTSLSVQLDVEPYDICTPELALGGVPAVDGTPCSIASLPPLGHLGNILCRTKVMGAPLVINFPGTCSTPCSVVGTTTTTKAPTPTTTSTKPTTVPTTSAVTNTFTGAPGTVVSGVVFLDTNGDGVTNTPVEPTVPNVRIYLQSFTNASDVRTTTSNSVGEYFFATRPSTFFLRVLNSTIPFGYQPTVVLSYDENRRANQYFASNLSSVVVPSFVDFSLVGFDLGLARVPPCNRRVPPSGPTGGLLVEFDSVQTSCVACPSLIKLRSKCTPSKCGGLMTRQLLDVEATISNTGPLEVGFGSLLLRLNSIGVGPLEADSRSYVCAEAFDVNATNAQALDSVSSTSASALAQISYGWTTLPVGNKVARVRAQFLYCAHDAITYFNVTAEVVSGACIETIRSWNRCDQTIDIRTCQATLNRTVPTCAGCPLTTANTLHPTATTLSPSLLNLNVQPYCFNPLCVNTNTFTQLGCSNLTEAAARCTSALNRGQVLHQATVSNPPSALTSEDGSLRITYARNSVADEQLLCGDKFSDHLPVFLVLNTSLANGTLLVEREENALDQTLEVVIYIPALPPAGRVLVSLVSFECSDYPLNATFTARLVTERCNDEALCFKTAPPMTSLTPPACIRYRATGCSETIEGERAKDFGIEGEGEAGDTDGAWWPYVVAGLIFVLIIGCACFLLFALRRRRVQTEERASKRIAAQRARGNDDAVVYRPEMARKPIN